MNSDLSQLPVETLEMYLSDLHRLKSLPQFNYEKIIRSRFVGDVNKRLEPPYTALAAAASSFSPSVTASSMLSHLRHLEQSGTLEDRTLKEVLDGIDSTFRGPGQLRQHGILEFDRYGSENLRALLHYDLPEEIKTDHIVHSLTIPGNVAKQGYDAANNIQQRDPDTALLLLKNLAKLHSIFTDKYDVVLNYFERTRKREHLYLTERIEHGDYVAEAIGKIELQGAGVRQGERLVRFAGNLDAIAELNESLQLSTEVKVEPDLRTSYENSQRALKGILDHLGIENLEDVIRFMPWIKTGDETAMQVLRGQEVLKYGKPTIYHLQQKAELDLEAMRSDIESYAHSANVELPNVSAEGLEGLQNLARYVMSEVTRRTDILPEVLDEVKPNLARILTTMDTAGSYALWIDPQDLKAQMEALQNVTSCLSPSRNGQYFRYTQEYMKNPYISWATIRGQQGIVGRVTLFSGFDENDNPAIARVSGVYAHVPIDEKEIDKSLESYAINNGMKFLEKGKLRVPGLKSAYDDFARSSDGDIVTVSR